MIEKKCECSVKPILVLETNVIKKKFVQGTRWSMPLAFWSNQKIYVQKRFHSGMFSVNSYLTYGSYHGQHINMLAVVLVNKVYACPSLLEIFFYRIMISMPYCFVDDSGIDNGLYTFVKNCSLQHNVSKNSSFQFTCVLRSYFFSNFVACLTNFSVIKINI